MSNSTNNIDLYANLNVKNISQKHLKEENERYKQEIKHLKAENEQQKIQLERLLNQNATLITNISILYDTAKLEISRKNDRINELRQNISNI